MVDMVCEGNKNKLGLPGAERGGHMKGTKKRKRKFPTQHANCKLKFPSGFKNWTKKDGQEMHRFQKMNSPPNKVKSWNKFKINVYRISLVAQWLSIRLSMQGTQVRALVREDPTCRGATKPVCHNYWACAVEPMSHNYWACVLQLLKPTCLEPMLCNKRSSHTATKSSPCSPQLEKACAQSNEDPMQPKIN